MLSASNRLDTANNRFALNGVGSSRLSKDLGCMPCHMGISNKRTQWVHYFYFLVFDVKE